VIAWLSHACISQQGSHGWWLALFSSLWGARLSLYLFWRNHGRPEDKRYAAMRAKAGRIPRAPVASTSSISTGGNPMVDLLAFAIGTNI